MDISTFAHITDAANGLPSALIGLTQAGALDFLDDDPGSSLAQVILDQVHVGLAVVGPQARVLLANQAAMHECARFPQLRIEEGRLIALRPGQHGTLARALATAREGKRALVQLAHGEEQLSLAVLPLSPRLGCPDTLLMVFGLRNAWRSLTLEFFAQACRLTAMEARVMRAFSDGLSPGQIACRHGVAMSTVRTHLASVRNKTGSRSLIELVRTLNALPPIMPTVVGVA